ncbi:MAG: hypothetical protein KF763_11410 [Cyclobacteriaceae bacterium]|nr:hypothetical protein [Cyclobacteriaceae bacterium]
MLIKAIHLQGIKSGTIKLAFRRWEKPAVKAGTLLKTFIGLVKVVRISTVKESQISKKDIQDAGFENKEQLLKSLRQNDNSNIYKIELRYHAEDPRIELRENTALTESAFADLKEKLVRLDKYSKQGLWTKKVLLAIKGNPKLRAVDLAKLTGFEKQWLKLNIRKLKNLGLTISHDVGYELSPLGGTFVKRLTREK